MSTNFYLERLYQDMQLRAYSEHTQDVYGRAVRSFLQFSRKPVESLSEQDVRSYTLHLMNGNLTATAIPETTLQVAALELMRFQNIPAMTQKLKGAETA